MKPDSSHEWPAIRYVQDPMRLHRRLRRRLLLPKSVADVTVSALRLLKSPSIAHRRRELAARFLRPSASSLAPVIDPNQGYCFFNSSNLPGGTQALQEAMHAFDERRASGSLPGLIARAGKNFLVAVAEDEALLAYPSITRLALSRSLVESATRYLGSVPVLSSARIFWTQANQTSERSQLFHRDAEGKRQVKFFMNLATVDERSGPLTFIPADSTERALATLGRSARRGKLKDAELESCGVLSEAQQLLGPRGAAAAVDTSRCLHFGSRNNERERFLLMIQFTPLGAPRVRIPNWGEALLPYLPELDELQLLALNRRRR